MKSHRHASGRVSRRALFLILGILLGAIVLVALLMPTHMERGLPSQVDETDDEARLGEPEIPPAMRPVPGNSYTTEDDDWGGYRGDPDEVTGDPSYVDEDDDERMETTVPVFEPSLSTEEDDEEVRPSGNDARSNQPDDVPDEIE